MARLNATKRLPKSPHGCKTTPDPGITTSVAESVAMGYAQWVMPIGPGYLPLHEGPRFDELVRRVGLK